MCYLGHSDGVIGSLIDKVIEASHLAGRPWGGLDSLNPRPLIDAGFVDVRVVEHEFAIGAGGSGGASGRMWLIALLEGFEATFLRLLTEQLGMSAEEVRGMCDQGTGELVAAAKDPEKSADACIKLRIMVGRKPHPNEIKNNTNLVMNNISNNNSSSSSSSSRLSDVRTPSPEEPLNIVAGPISVSNSPPLGSRRKARKRGKKKNTDGGRHGVRQ
jgi:hypothetical protein